MKFLYFLLAIPVLGVAQGQEVITAANFDSEKMNKALVTEFNKFRKERNLDTLIYSKALFDTVSYQNCVEISNSGKLYHPDITERWKNNEVKRLIEAESKALFNDNIARSTTGLPAMEYWENIFRWSITSFESYESMAKYAIENWEKSPKHQATQNTSFLNEGLPGFFACHSAFIPNGHIYLVINFVRVIRS